MANEENILAKQFIQIELELNQSLKTIIFPDPISYIYNPIDYAYDVHSKFIHKYCCNLEKVPFGEVSLVRDWLKLDGEINHPDNEHPKRKIEGFLCKRSEVSGKRFWNLFKDICGTPDIFFKNAFVYNYCPMAFMDSKGKNITPAEMKQSSAKKELFSACDDALKKIIQLLKIKTIVAIGKFAEKKAEEMKEEIHLEIHYITHPSPRNPKNKDWINSTKKELVKKDLMKYFCNIMNK